MEAKSLTSKRWQQSRLRRLSQLGRNISNFAFDETTEGSMHSVDSSLESKSVDYAQQNYVGSLSKLRQRYQQAIVA